jgi:hypothetical protein
LEKVSYALTLQPGDLAYLRERAEILECRLRFKEAVAAYDAVVQRASSDKQAREHRELCRQLSDEQTNGTISRAGLLQLLRTMVAERRPRVQIVSIVGTLGVNSSISERLRVSPEGLLTLRLIASDIPNLNALIGFPLSEIEFAGCENLTSIEFSARCLLSRSVWKGRA